MPASPLTLLEGLAWMVRSLFEAVSGQQIGRVLGGRIPGPLILPILARITSFRDRFNRLAGRIVAGTYVPRRYRPRPAPLDPKPRPESPFRKSGWLAAMLPPAMAAQYRGGLNALLQHPEMAALIEAAPAPMARLLRPLCWMLKLKPPEILANPSRPAGTPPPIPPKYRAPPPPPPPIPGPANTLGLHPIQLAPMRSPPKPA